MFEQIFSWIRNLSMLNRGLIIGVMFIFGLLALKSIIKSTYGAEKPKIKLLHIMGVIICFGIVVLFAVA